MSCAKFYVVGKLSKNILSSKFSKKSIAQNWAQNDQKIVLPTCYCKIQSDPVKAAEGNLRLTDLKKRQKSVKKKYKNTVSVARTNLT